MATLFDYKNQAWTVDGVYVDCGHPPVGTVMGAGSPAPGEVFQGCKCYSKAHVGESVPSEVVAEMEERERETLWQYARHRSVSRKWGS